MMEPAVRKETGKYVPKSSRDKPTSEFLALAHFQSTLVKYENPIIVFENEKKEEEGDNEVQEETRYFPPILILNPINHCISRDILRKKETERVLYAIIKAREWRDEHGSLWRQLVSKVPATKDDILNLEEELNRRLKQKHARETGLCPIRREIYAQCFDELIRQVTVTCSARGVLLVAVRDELNTTMKAYETLYESSAAYGMRKALMVESKKNELDALINATTVERDELQLNISDLQAKIDEVDRKYNEQRAGEESEYSRELEYHKMHNQQLKHQLLAAVAVKRR